MRAPPAFLPALLKAISTALVLFALPLTAVADPIVGPAPQRVEDRYVPKPNDVKLEIWVEGLEVPWSLVFLPGSERALVSERPGRIRLIVKGKLREKPYMALEAARGQSGLFGFFTRLFAGGEGGLMGLAVHPRFPEQPYIYAMHTYRSDKGTFNRVIRLIDQGDSARYDRVILDGIPGASLHNGGRIAFGPDGLLYVSTGEIYEAEHADDLKSLGGKILRVTPDGAIPPDNPFPDSPVYSYGHRNPQGLAWHPGTGDLFISEHGPSGEFGLGAHDEINVIRRGGHYGWPRAVGAPGHQKYVDPLISWKRTTTPPAGLAFWRGDLYLAVLGSGTLIRIGVSGKKGNYRITRIERLFAKGPQESVLGRLRAVAAGPDGLLYFSSSNRDGRGDPAPGDDKIYRLVP
ncbi:MAG: PQQ-dependent sugar dehydrogenase [Rhodospirillales bacterium]